MVTAGIFLVSKTVADMLSQLRDWRDYLHELGEHSVKHGEKIVLFNLYGADFGNQEQPAKIAAPLPPAGRKKSQMKMIAATAVVAVALVAAVNWKSLVCRLSPSSSPCVAAVTTQRTTPLLDYRAKVPGRPALSGTVPGSGRNDFRAGLSDLFAPEIRSIGPPLHHQRGSQCLSMGFPAITCCFPSRQ